MKQRQVSLIVNQNEEDNKKIEHILLAFTIPRLFALTHQKTPEEKASEHIKLFAPNIRTQLYFMAIPANFS